MNNKLQKLVEKIPGWLTTAEADFLVKTAKQTENLKGVIVEIGSYCGKSTICLAQSNGKVYAIDPHKGNIEENRKYRSTFHKFKKTIKEAQVSHKVTPIVDTSENAAKQWNKSIRTLFIDGLHDEENAALDYALWSKHVVPGGIIAIHDSFLRWCGSEKVAMKNIVRSGEFSKIGVAGSIVYGIKGKATVMQQMRNLMKRAFVVLAVELNHVRIVLSNLAVIKSKFFHQTTISASR